MISLFDKIHFGEKEKKPIRFEFHPVDDITTYELTVLIPLMFRVRFER